MYLSTEQPKVFDYLREENRNISYSVSDNIYRISFIPIQFQFNESSYYIKAIYKDGLIEGEKIDTIALSESKGKYMQINNPPFIPNKTMTYELKLDKEISYIKVMVRFNFYGRKLLYLYRPIEVKKEEINKVEPKSTDDITNSDYKILYIIIGVIGSVIVVVIAVFLFIYFYYKRNQEFKSQIGKISFIESGARERIDRNILLFNDED